MEHFTKFEQNPYADLSWNIPDNKQGSVYVFGGNSQSFNTEIKIAESLSKTPVKDVTNVFPDTLSKSLPPLSNFKFLPSTESGSLAESDELNSSMNEADFNIMLGDFSKNSITERAVISACEKAEKPTLILRDAVDLIASGNPENILANPNIIIFASTPQFQKLCHAIYYPKVITLSQPLTAIVDTLHKFTLSYPATIILFNNGQLLVAKDGKISSVPLTSTPYSMITLWTGEIATKIAIYNIYNPNQFEKATIAALFS